MRLLIPNVETQSFRFSMKHRPTGNNDTSTRQDRQRHSALVSLMPIIGCLFLAGCVNLGSQADTTRWYMLDQYAVLETPEAELSTEGSLHVAGPQLPEYLNSSRIFYRTEAGAPRYTEQERWTEPFSDTLARTLALRLSRETRIATVSHFPAPQATEGASRVHLHLLQFEGIRSHSVVIDLIWRVDRPDARGEPRRLRLTGTVEDFSSIDHLVQAMSELLDRVAERIATEIDPS